MDGCDVLIVGGGPAGSSCAWELRGSNLQVTILDTATFPRNKVCGGWITPAVLEELELDAEEYGAARTLQPIRGFRTSRMGGHEVEVLYPRSVSYGILRREFDHFLLKRSGARILQGTSLDSLERKGDGWHVNGAIRAKVLVGAGGHFCPVARHVGARIPGEPIVAAQEVEFLMSEAQQRECAVAGEIPELYFGRDLKGYGWCFRKGNYLNVGLGRLDRRRLSSHVADFIAMLEKAGRVPRNMPRSLPGHAYLLYGASKRTLVDDGVLLTGDAAGLAYAQSGEGIRPAVESGLLAARTILEAGGDYSSAKLRGYEHAIRQRFGSAELDWSRKIASRVPDRLVSALAGPLMATRWFARHVVINRWFLHAHEPPLPPARHARVKTGETAEEPSLVGAGRE